VRLEREDPWWRSGDAREVRRRRRTQRAGPHRGTRGAQKKMTAASEGGRRGRGRGTWYISGASVATRGRQKAKRRLEAPGQQSTGARSATADLGRPPTPPRTPRKSPCRAWERSKYRIAAGLHPRRARTGTADWRRPHHTRAAGRFRDQPGDPVTLGGACAATWSAGRRHGASVLCTVLCKRGRVWQTVPDEQSLSGHRGRECLSRLPK
jgi:hypothetical protein